jgi:hypothetical protein
MIGGSSSPSVSPSRGPISRRAPGPRERPGPPEPVPGRGGPSEATAPPCACVGPAVGAPASCCGPTIPGPGDGAEPTPGVDGDPGGEPVTPVGVRPESGPGGAAAAARGDSDGPRADPSAPFAASPVVRPLVTPADEGAEGVGRDSRACRCADATPVGWACGPGAPGGTLSEGGSARSRSGAVSTGPPPDTGAGGVVRPALAGRPSSAGGPTGGR